MHDDFSITQKFWFYLSPLFDEKILDWINWGKHWYRNSIMLCFSLWCTLPGTQLLMMCTHTQISAEHTASHWASKAKHVVGPKQKEARKQLRGFSVGVNWLALNSIKSLNHDVQGNRGILQPLASAESRRNWTKQLRIFWVSAEKQQLTKAWTMSIHFNWERE